MAKEDVYNHLNLIEYQMDQIFLKYYVDGDNKPLTSAPFRRQWSWYEDVGS